MGTIPDGLVGMGVDDDARMKAFTDQAIDDGRVGFTGLGTSLIPAQAGRQAAAGAEPPAPPLALQNLATMAVFMVKTGGALIPSGTICESNGQIAVLDDKGEPFPDGARICLWLPKKLRPNNELIMAAVQRSALRAVNAKAQLMLEALK